MADDDWIEDDEVNIAQTTYWSPPKQTKRPPRPRNPTDKRDVLKVGTHSFTWKF